MNLTRGKVKLNVFCKIIFYLIEVSLSKNGSKVKIPCILLMIEFLTDLDLSLSEKELTVVINTSEKLFIKKYLIFS
jgi:hypothetical protein